MATIKYADNNDLSYFGYKMWQKMKDYVALHPQEIHFDEEALANVNAINNDPTRPRTSDVDESAYALVTRGLLYDLLRPIGYSAAFISALKFRDAVSIFQGLIKGGLGIFIQDVNGLRWSLESWTLAKSANGGINPTTPVGIAVITDTVKFLVGLGNSTLAWGTYQLNVSNLVASTDMVAGDYTCGDFNTRLILKWADPMVIWNREHSDPYEDEDGDVFYFTGAANNKAAADAAAAYRYANNPSTADGTEAYVVDNNGTLENYYWQGTSRTLQKRTNACPYVNGSLSGAPAAKYCYEWQFVGLQTSAFKWHMMTAPEALIYALNRNTINTYITAAGGTVVPSGGVWTCLQNYATIACYLSGTSLNSDYKSFTYIAVPFALLNN